MDVAVHALNRMLEFGRPISVRIASTRTGLGQLCSHPWSMPMAAHVLGRAADMAFDASAVVGEVQSGAPGGEVRA